VERVNGVESSLRAKGVLSYYYAHGRAESAAPAAEPAPAPITNYAWADDGAQVKVYIPWPGAQALSDDQVRLELLPEAARLELAVAQPDRREPTSIVKSRLSLLLYDRVKAGAVKRKGDRMTLTLAKAKPDREWIALTRKPWDALPQ
jgi:hypothetical protein